MIKIIVDSGCDLNDHLRNEVGVSIVPLTLQLDGKEFIDDETLDLESYMNEMSKSSSVKSAAPSPQRFLEAFKGEESVFVVTINSVLSGTYNSALLAKQMYLDEIGDKFIHIFDSLNVSCAESLIAIKIHELSKLNLSNLEIVDGVSKFMEHQRLLFILERFDSLVKTGRVNPIIAKVASVLNIKPVCTTIKGTVVMSDKARGFKKAVSKLVETVEKEGFDLENKILGITHIKCLDKANYVKDELLKKTKFKDVVIFEPTGITSTYGSTGGILVSF